MDELGAVGGGAGPGAWDLLLEKRVQGSIAGFGYFFLGKEWDLGEGAGPTAWRARIGRLRCRSMGGE